MSITKEEFNRRCVDFVSRSRDLNETWSIYSDQLDEVNIDDPNIQDMTIMLAKNDISCESPGLIIKEYNVVYSESYEVPIMYYSVSYQDGSLKNLVDLDPSITQVEHPFHHRPFYMLHPCRTKECLESLVLKDYLLSWLSTVSLLVGLKINPNLAIACDEKQIKTLSA